MDFTDLTGTLCRLKLVTPGAIAKLHERLQIRRNWDEVGFMEPPDVEKVKRYIAQKRFIFWEVFPNGGHEAVGYFGMGRNLGAPNVYVDWFKASEKPNLEILHECLLLTLPEFFRKTNAEWLFAVIPRALQEEFEPRLIEAGFDPMPERVGWNPKNYAAYAILRNTYVAYYEDTDPDDLGGTTF